MKRLLQEDVQLKLYDPKASRNFMAALGEDETGKLKIANSLNDAIEGAEMIIVCTEWAEIVNSEKKVSALEGLRIVLDGRNIWNKQLFSEAGKMYMGVGV